MQHLANVAAQEKIAETEKKYCAATRNVQIT
jgi:hypothetical protein